MKLATSHHIEYRLTGIQVYLIVYVDDLIVSASASFISKLYFYRNFSIWAPIHSFFLECIKPRSDSGIYLIVLTQLEDQDFSQPLKRDQIGL